MATKTVTFQDIIAAMEKNGFEPLIGYFWEGYTGEEMVVEIPKAACIWGQAAINLGVNPTSLYTKVNYSIEGRPASRIAGANDFKGYSAALEKARKLLSKDKEVEVETLEYE